MIDGIVAALTTDPSSQEGFVVGLISAAVLGFLASRLLYFWGVIMQFFSPTRRPATNPGPTPADTFSGCVVSALAFLVVALLVALVIGFIISPPPG